MRKLKECSHEQFDQLKRCVPELFDGEHTFKVLYVGACKNFALGSHELKDAGHMLIMIDVIEDYVEWARNQPMFDHAVHCDVRELDSIISKENAVDVVYWRHGPEHIECDEIESTVAQLERAASYVVIMAGPNGFASDHDEGTPGMEHKCILRRERFTGLGYNVDLLPARSGAKFGGGTTLLAWKYLS